jgi:hypothetical protein
MEEIIDTAAQAIVVDAGRRDAIQILGLISARGDCAAAPFAQD